MGELLLVIGDKNLSSWSMRPWLLMKELQIPFREEKVLLDRPDTHQEILRWSPSGKVPALVQSGLVVNDSLAIIEYLAEIFPAIGIWPAARDDRARARSVCAEMHSSFANLRREMPMNLKVQYAWKEYPASVMQELERIFAVWRECLERSGGPCLFTAYSAVDAMYAPVVTRLLTYSVPLEDKKIAAYVQHIRSLRSVEEMYQDARAE